MAKPVKNEKFGYRCCDFKGIRMIVLNRKYISMLGLAFKAVTSRSLCVCSNSTATLSSYFITVFRKLC